MLDMVMTVIQFLDGWLLVAGWVYVMWVDAKEQSAAMRRARE
jgi:hypothetical protein